MLSINRRKRVIIQLLIVLSLDTTIQGGQNIGGYFKAEAGMETNVFESDSTSRLSLLMPLTFNLNYRLNRQRLNVFINSTGGFLAYDLHTENKATLNLIAQADYNISRSLFISSAVNTFQKWWLCEDYVYNNTDGRIGAGLNFNRWIAIINIILAENSYHHKKCLSNHQIGGLAEIRYQISPGFSFSTQGSWVGINYPFRNVISESNSALDTLDLQQDTYAFGQIGFEWRRRALYGLRLKVVNVASNNAFSEYFGASLNYYLSGKIGRSYYQIIADILLKKYKADLSQYFLYYNPDPEQNVQNQLLFGWEWPLWKHLAITGRAAVMRNETHYSGLYYDKWFFSGGLIYRSD